MTYVKVHRHAVRDMVHKATCRYAKKAIAMGHAHTITMDAKAIGYVKCRTCMGGQYDGDTVKAADIAAMAGA